MVSNQKQTKNCLIERVLRTFERNRTNVLTAFLVVFLLAFIRAALDINLFIMKTDAGHIYLHTFPEWAFVISFFITVFLAGVLVLSLLSKTKVRQVVNAVLCGFWIILLPPIIDYYIFGVRDIREYAFASLIDIWSNLTTLFVKFPKGLIIQGSIILLLTFSYALIKSFPILVKSKGRIGASVEAVIRGVLTLPSMLLIMAIFGSMDLEGLGLLPAPPEELYIVVMLNDIPHFVCNPYQVIGFELLFFISLILVAVLIDVSNKKILPYFIGNFRPFRTLQFLFLGVVGIIISSTFVFIKNGAIYYFDFPYLLLCLLALAFGWQFTSMMNDIYDMEINKRIRKKSALATNVLSKSQNLHVAVLTAIFSFAISILLGPIPMLFTLGCIFLACIYCVPPLRLKRNRIAGSFVIGLGSVFAYFIGYFSANSTAQPFPFVFGNREILVPTTPAILSQEASILALIIFIIIFLIHFFQKK
jgi:4-hydroxybenzoate polyprenyltransferase